MRKFFNVFKKGFYEGWQKTKDETEARKDGTVKVIVFEDTGETKLATLHGANLSALRQCPQELLDCIPSEIVSFCRKTAPRDLYLIEDENGDISWNLLIKVKFL